MFQTAGPCSLSPLSAKPARLAGWMLLMVALLAAGVYANSLWNGFAFDDVGVIQNNPHVTDLAWSEIWTSNYWGAKDGMQPDVLYRPLTLWTYLVNQWFTPGVAWPFHLVNVLLHALVSVLVCVLTWRILGDWIIAADRRHFVRGASTAYRSGRERGGARGTAGNRGDAAGVALISAGDSVDG